MPTSSGLTIPANFTCSSIPSSLVFSSNFWRAGPSPTIKNTRSLLFSRSLAKPCRSSAVFFSNPSLPRESRIFFSAEIPSAALQATSFSSDTCSLNLSNRIPVGITLISPHIPYPRNVRSTFRVGAMIHSTFRSLLLIHVSSTFLSITFPSGIYSVYCSYNV